MPTPLVHSSVTSMVWPDRSVSYLIQKYSQSNFVSSRNVAPSVSTRPADACNWPRVGGAKAELRAHGTPSSVNFQCPAGKRQSLLVEKSSNDDASQRRFSVQLDSGAVRPPSSSTSPPQGGKDTTAPFQSFLGRGELLMFKDIAMRRSKSSGFEKSGLRLRLLH